MDAMRGPDGVDCRPLVSVVCAAYNQIEYVSTAIESFLMQETEFCTEILVHDDASTDGTADLIQEYARKYPDRIRFIGQTENQYSKGVRIPALLLAHAKGEFVAYCEADDFWTVPHKLQMQAEYLLANQNVSAVFTDKNVRYEASGVVIEDFDSSRAIKVMSGDVRKSLIRGNPYATCTVMFRRSCVEGYESVAERSRAKMDDYVMWLIAASRGEVHYLATTTATYRVLSESASHSSSVFRTIRFARSGFRVRAYFNEVFEAPLTAAELRFAELDMLARISVQFGLWRSLIRRLCTTKGGRQFRLRVVAREAIRRWTHRVPIARALRNWIRV